MTSKLDGLTPHYVRSSQVGSEADFRARPRGASESLHAEDINEACKTRRLHLSQVYTPSCSRLR